jgi:hypothetical protein
VRTYHEGFPQTLKIGTFYLAGIRNFLFGSDTLRFFQGEAYCYFVGQAKPPNVT